MLGFDVILVVGLVAVILSIIIIAAKNNTKIKKLNTKKPDTAQTAIIPKPEEIKMEIEQGNYLQDYFSQYGPNVSFEDADEPEPSMKVQMARKKISELQTGLIDMNLLNKNNRQEFDDDDFDGSLADDYEEEEGEAQEPSAKLQDEFNSLSPQMKAFMIANGFDRDKMKEVVLPKHTNKKD